MPRRVLLLAVALLASAAGACSDGDDGAELTPDRAVEVVRVLPHRTDAYTQGLVWDDGTLLESTGLVGASSLARIDLTDGSVDAEVAVDPGVFAEGLALVGDRLVQLTWKDEVAFVWDAESFALVDRFGYDGEGWGLCHDGSRLVMSDGSADLTFRDPETFAELGSVRVRRDGDPVEQLNELECVGDRVYANVWHTDTIVEIDPSDGSVTAVIDVSALRSQLDPPPTDAQAVLNGIAHDSEKGTFWLTGKLWPQLFEVRIEPAG